MKKYWQIYAWCLSLIIITMASIPLLAPENFEEIDNPKTPISNLIKKVGL